MITLKELNPQGYATTPEIDANLADLLVRINVVRTAYGKPMYVTSGVRSAEKQAELIKSGISNAPKSRHLTGQALDVLDTDGSLNEWLKANEQVLVDAGLWCERRQGPWQHFQSVPPKSGMRWFFP